MGVTMLMYCTWTPGWSKQESWFWGRFKRWKDLPDEDNAKHCCEGYQYKLDCL